MQKDIAEVVKEYVMSVEGLGFSIKGRITKSTTTEGKELFRWEISHHYCPSKNAASTYYPSKLSSNSLEEVEALLKLYMSGFTTIDVTPNKNY